MELRPFNNAFTPVPLCPITIEPIWNWDLCEYQPSTIRWNALQSNQYGIETALDALGPVTFSLEITIEPIWNWDTGKLFWNRKTHILITIEPIWNWDPLTHSVLLPSPLRITIEPIWNWDLPSFARIWASKSPLQSNQYGIETERVQV